MKPEDRRELGSGTVKFKAGEKQNNTTDTSQRFVEDFKTILSLL